jgi:hypothetical protein
MRFHTTIALAAVIFGMANSAPAPLPNNAIAVRSYTDEKRDEAGALNAKPACKIFRLLESFPYSLETYYLLLIYSQKPPRHIFLILTQTAFRMKILTPCPTKAEKRDSALNARPASENAALK